MKLVVSNEISRELSRETNRRATTRSRMKREELLKGWQRERMISRSFPAVARELCKEKSLSVAIRGGSAIRADVGGVVEHRLSPSFAILAARIFRLFLFLFLFSVFSIFFFFSS